MIERVLQMRLERVAQRERWLRWLGVTALCWTEAAVLFAIFIFADVRLSTPAAAALGFMAILATGLVALLAGRRRIDVVELARRIEKEYPDLRSLLLAAVEQTPRGPDGELGYLQERVIDEAIEHARRQKWIKAVPTWHLATAGACHVVWLLFFVAAWGTLLQRASAPAPAAPVAAAPTKPVEAVTVLPGDVTVERGSRLAVTARFAAAVPTEATLVVGKIRLPMTQSLNDPVFGVTLPEVAGDLTYRVEYGASGKTRDFAVKTFEHPELVRADARVAPPAFLGKPEETIENTRVVSVAEGSTLVWRLQLNKPATGTLGDLALVPDPERAAVYIVTLTPKESRAYDLKLTDVEGRRNKKPARLEVTVLKNLPPAVKALQPRRDVTPSAIEELVLAAEATDDNGVTAVGVRYWLEGGEPREETLREGDAAPTRRFDHLLALEVLGAKPDDLLTYHFWAEDVGPDGKPRRVPGDLFFAEVRPFEQIYREGAPQSGQQQQQQQQPQQGQGQAGQLAEMQKLIILSTWNLQRQATPNYIEVEEVRKSQEQVKEQAEALAEKAATPRAVELMKKAIEQMGLASGHLGRSVEGSTPAPLEPALAAEQSAYQALLKLRAREFEITQQQRNQRGKAGAQAKTPRSVNQLELKLKDKRYEDERKAEPEAQAQSQQRENLDVLNRLRDLARRQDELNEQRRDLEAALREAKTAEEREELSRRLKRLQEEQEQMLRDVDALAQQMDRSQNRQSMEQERRQLDQTRERVQQAAEALAKGKPSEAEAPGARAKEELDQLKEEFRRRASGRFDEEMRKMRENARSLAQEQRRIGEEVQRKAEAEKAGQAQKPDDKLGDRIEGQGKKADELFEQMKRVSEESESAEPLLSRKLYDTLRKGKTGDLEQALDAAEQWARYGFLRHAKAAEERAAPEVRELARGVEEAAKGVLGDDTEALKRAGRELEDLKQQMEGELGEAKPSTPPGEQPKPGEATAQGKGKGTAPGEQPTPGEPTTTPGKGTTPGERPNLEQGYTDRRHNGGNERPLTGADFRNWAGRLRDVEEMLEDPELRDQAARAREAAQAARAEFRTHSKPPDRELVRTKIIEPMTELRKRIDEELARRDPGGKRVPTDRDPVPERFLELVRKYYERLGAGE